MPFVKTDTILDKILAHKAEELQAVDSAFLAQSTFLAMQAPPARDFVAALQRDTVALIAEVKKASPSKGVFLHEFDPVAIGTAYAENGAAAISVLVDQKFFLGHIRYLRDVRRAVSVPVLYKEFVIDIFQVYEARANHADAVLLIAAALDDVQLQDLHQLIHELGMAALVEVHTETEVDRALKIGATLIGVNNRDLKTFSVDLNTTARLAKLLPEHVTLVAESGIGSAEDVKHMGELGAHAVLVGEALVTSGNIPQQVKLFSQQPHP